MKIHKGMTRIVFAFKHFVVKFPRLCYGHQHFLKGCCSNWNERTLCKDFKYFEGEPNLYFMVAPSLYCSVFGLFQIQVKCSPKLEDIIEAEKKLYFSICGSDNKKENFGWYRGRLVCLDYG